MASVCPGIRQVQKVRMSSGLLAQIRYNARNIHADNKKAKRNDNNWHFSYDHLVNNHSKTTERNHMKENTKLCSLSSENIIFNKKYESVALKILEILHQTKEELGTPGICFAISHHGELVLKGGIGLADVENHVTCTSKTVMRIASISKSLTTLAIGKLMEEGKLDIHKPIQEYVPNFPLKTFDGSNVAITTYHLLSNTSGIRGYFDNKDKELRNDKSKRKRKIQISKYGANFANSDEMYSKHHYETVNDGLALFECDPLLFKPGTDLEYSSFAYTLVSCIVEKVSKVSFVEYMKTLCGDLEMDNTMIDLNDPLIYHRARNYVRKDARLENAPYVDNSYKLSGGGFLSNVEDLQKFGNAMVISADTDRGYLKPSTMSILWKPVRGRTVKECPRYLEAFYALGWGILLNKEKQRQAIYHTGGAVGANSILMICDGDQLQQNRDQKSVQPNGSVVTIMVNIGGDRLINTALKIKKCLQEDI